MGAMPKRGIFVFARLEAIFLKDSQALDNFRMADHLSILPDAIPGTFQQLEVFGMDGRHLYYRDQKVPGVSGEKLELVNVIDGYRKGCGLDPNPTSNHYVLKNLDGYWVVTVTSKAKETAVRKLGSILPAEFAIKESSGAGASEE